MPNAMPTCNTRLSTNTSCSAHAKKNVNCLDCHQPAANQPTKNHNGFVIADHLTANNCRACHDRVYQQFLRSRHAAPSWAAVYGDKDLSAEQVDFAERSIRVPASALPTRWFPAKGRLHPTPAV